SYSQTTYNLAPLATNPILKGPAGNVTGLKYDSGSSMTLNRTANPTVTGLIFKTGASNTGTTNAMFVTSTYGSGRVCGIADSSPSDDGTGDNNDVLYSSYRTSVSGSHQKMFINAVLWLTGTTSFASPVQELPVQSERISSSFESLSVFPIPAHDRLYFSANALDGKVYLRFTDLLGRNIANYEANFQSGRFELDLDRTLLSKGIYLLSIVSGDKQKLVRVIID
ncbi:MAG: T9SS type A sorting domain-containing protein, partial [Bacteroidota bacterium]